MYYYIFLILLLLFLILFIIYYFFNNIKFNFINNNDDLPILRNYNPSIIVKSKNNIYSYIINNEDDDIIMTFRNNLDFSFYNSKIYICNYLLKYNTINNIQLIQHNYSKTFEDSRLFSFNNNLYLSMTDVIIDNNILTPKMIVMNYDTKTLYINNYLNNIKNKLKWEKNWQYFEHNNKFYLLYSIQPFIIYEINNTTFDIIDIVVNYKWNNFNNFKLRCSTPPIFLNNVFYILSHYYYYKNNIKYYNVIIITFNENFKIINYTINPIFDNNKAIIYYPCGFIYNKIDNNFIISCGIDDKFISIIKINKFILDVKLYLSTFYKILKIK